MHLPHGEWRAAILAGETGVLLCSNPKQTEPNLNLNLILIPRSGCWFHRSGVVRDIPSAGHAAARTGSPASRGAVLRHCI